MKKTLALAIALTLSVTASALANDNEAVKISGEVRAHYGDSDVGLCHSVLLFTLPTITLTLITEKKFSVF